MTGRPRVEFPSAECLQSAARSAEAIRSYWSVRGYRVDVSVDARTGQIVCADIVDGKPLPRCWVNRRAVAS